MADIYERTPGKWYLRARVDGKRIHRLAGSSKSEAMAALKQFKRSRAVRDRRQPNDPLVPDLCAEYLESVQYRIAQATFRGYLNSLNSFAIRSFKHLHTSEITSEAINFAVSEVVRRGNTARSINQTLTVLMIVLRYAKSRGYIDSVPKFTRLKEFDREFPDISISDIEDYFSRADPDLRDFTFIMLHTGLRVTELLNVEWRDIDFEKSQIHVRSVLSLKSSHGGMIPFGDAVRSVLTNRHDRIGPFSSLTYPQLRCRHLKMKVKFRMYDFRHLFCTNLLEAGVDPATVSKLMRHDIKMTMRVYHHLRLDHAREAISKLPVVTYSTPKVVTRITKPSKLSSHEI